MKKQNLKTNLLLQSAYQFLILGAPLIISPYLTRTLGSQPLGVYSYSYSIAHYFVIVAMLGISRHGQRAIAASVNDDLKLRKSFWSLFSVHVTLSLVAFFAYMICVFTLITENRDIFAVQGLYVLSALFDITWLFYGLENFKSVVIKNTVVKIVELIAIFAFVKSPSDIVLYTAIMSSSICVGQAIMIPQAIATVKPIRFGLFDVREHIKPLFVLGVSVIAVTLYTVFDKTLLGVMLDMSSVSFYEYSNKIVTVPKTLLGVIATVMFPRVCRVAKEKNKDQLQEIFSLSLIATAFFGCGITSVLIGSAKTLAPLYLGKEFELCGNVIMTMSPIILIIAIGDLVRTQLMIPNHKDKEFVFCLIINAFVNIVLSIVFIQICGIYGAVIGTLSAEMCGLVLETYLCRNMMNISRALAEFIPFAIFGVISVVSMLVIYSINGGTVSSLILQIAAGGIIYAILAGGYLVLNKRELIMKVWRR